MRALFLLFSLRHLLSRRFRALLGFAAVALGVAPYTSTTIIIQSTQESMRENARALAGRAEWQVTRGGSLGVEESLAGSLRRAPGAIVAPIIQSSAVMVEPRAGTLMVLGVDFGSDSLLRLYRFSGAVDPLAFAATAFIPDGVVLAKPFALEHGLHPGDTIRVGTRIGVQTLTVTGLLEPVGPARAFPGGFGVMELHAAQRLFGGPGFVDRIEVAGASRAQIERGCPGCEVTRAGQIGSVAEDAIGRMESLGALSVVAMLVGLLIIYNSVQVSVVELWRQIGTLRALGATRRQLLVVIVLEWSAVAVCGSVVGVALGYGLARGMLQYTVRALNAMLPLVTTDHLRLPAALALISGLSGIATAGLAAALGSWWAVRQPPLRLLRPHAVASQRGFMLPFAAGLVLVAAGVGSVYSFRSTPSVSLIATALLFLGVVVMMPQIVLSGGRGARGALGRLFGVEGFLAADNMVKAPQRTALTAVTLGGALALMIASATMLEGFRTATSRWIRQALPMDFTVTPINFANSLYSGQTIPRSLLEEIRRTSGAEIVYGVRSLFAEFRGNQIMIVGVETRPYFEVHRRRGLSEWARGIAGEEVVRRLATGEGIIVSDNFAALYGVRPGEDVRLQTPTGEVPLRVVRSVEDYSWLRGTMIMDLDVLARLWKDDSLTYVDVYAGRPAAIPEVRARISERLRGRYSLYLFDRNQIARISDDVLRQTVAVADVQVVTASVIGFLGIVNSLLIGVLQRYREIGLLRAIGMTAGGVGRMVVLEGVFVAVLAGGIGVAGGLLGGWIPLRQFSFAMTGLLFPVVTPWHTLGISLATAIVLGLVASLLPARRAAALNVLDAIGYE